ncbi:MAG: UDP-N-acetylmuramoyl-L-alanyl-D-glutamate--2,6-diaminopimelate ligase [Granulosicoccus sp.]|nr:UDP-N-acetylmuramoyl-L-alanyl-D-glutamate--2,6-diaminopimelate ligase [Granulosicoccus sp.]
MKQTTANNWTLDSLLEDLSGESLPPVSVSGVCLDSRLVRAGDAYLAVAGATTHGMRFADAAVAAGAVAVVCSAQAMQLHDQVVGSLRESGIPVIGIEGLDRRCAEIASRFYGAPDEGMTVIAVTGTDGKTSVCRFITQAFTAIGQPCGYIGTLGWGMGDALQSTELTTPDAVTLRRMLAVMKSQGASVVALEASSHGLAEGRLDGLHLDVAVLTNLGRDHLDYHETLEAYRAAKAMLFSWPGLASRVVNSGDRFGQEMLAVPGDVRRYAYCSGAAVSSLGSDPGVDVVTITAHDVICDDRGLHFTLQDAEATASINTPLLGSFNVDNLLACYASLRACGVAANQASHSLAAVAPVAGRMERFGRPGGATVVVDYSHTPQALGAAIEASRVHCHGSLWVVFGCGGDRDPGKRAPMAAAAEAADHVVLTDDNPRTERSEDIIRDALQGFVNPSAVTVIGDRARAIEYAITHAARKDLVLIAGKGHEDYQVIGTTRHPFSDRAQVLSVLERAS